MKKLILPIILVIFSAFFFKFSASTALANSHCITFKVDIKASHWPGGNLQIGCPGDGGHVCTGQVVTVRPGQKHVKLGKCSCYPNENGCLKIGKKLRLPTTPAHGKRKIEVVTPLPNKCKITKKSNFCGSNGQIKNAKFKITCQTKKPSIVTPSICVGPKPVANVKVTCPDCDTNNGPTPTPAPLAQEGESCATNETGTDAIACAEGLSCQNIDETGVGTCEARN
jgi:hypothetical protein